MNDGSTSSLGAPRLAVGPVDDVRPAHLVLREDWPIALCGARVVDHLGNKATGRDRCPECLKIAGERGLGRPGWLTPPEGA